MILDSIALISQERILKATKKPRVQRARDGDEEPDPKRPRPEPEDPVEVTIKITKVASQLPVTEGGQRLIQVYDILMKRCFRKLDLREINRVFFDMNPNAVIEVDRNRCIIVAPAYLTAIRQLEGGMMLNCTVKYRPMPNSVNTVLGYMSDVMKRCQNDKGAMRVSSVSIDYFGCFFFLQIPGM
jgi:hypothetical protein